MSAQPGGGGNRHYRRRSRKLARTRPPHRSLWRRGILSRPRTYDEGNSLRWRPL